jgi:hypothetical protein
LVADLVHYDDAEAEVGAEFAGQAHCGFGGGEVADHVVEAGEIDRVAGPAGRDGEGDGDVGVADPGRSEQGGVRFGLDEGEGGEVLDLARVQVGLEGEVVALQLSGVMVKMSCRVAVHHAADASGRRLRFIPGPGRLLLEVGRCPVEALLP